MALFSWKLRLNSAAKFESTEYSSHKVQLYVIDILGSNINVNRIIQTCVASFFFFFTDVNNFFLRFSSERANC